MGLRAELRCPLDVFAGLGIKHCGQALLLREHVARPGLTPLRLVRSTNADRLSCNNQAATKRHAPNSKPPAATPAVAHEVEKKPQEWYPTSFHERMKSGNTARHAIPLMASSKPCPCSRNKPSPPACAAAVAAGR